VLYILDEPSIGLHQRDNRRLLDTLVRLRDLGNTVLVVEHDEETIRMADRVIDMGPAPASTAAEVIAEGTPAEIGRTPARSPASTFRERSPSPHRKSGEGRRSSSPS